jgi:hypothetical protein
MSTDISETNITSILIVEEYAKQEIGMRQAERCALKTVLFILSYPSFHI